MSEIVRSNDLFSLSFLYGKTTRQSNELFKSALDNFEKDVNQKTPPHEQSSRQYVSRPKLNVSSTVKGAAKFQDIFDFLGPTITPQKAASSSQHLNYQYQYNSGGNLASNDADLTNIYESLNINCTNADFVLYERSKVSPFIETLNLISYVIIIIGIFFNILNLIVLLKSKLNESPYTYLTMLAFSDLGAISMVGIEKLRQLIWADMPAPVNNLVPTLTDYSHLYVAAGINVFLSSSMYITLALTIERFIFVHSPFKAMLICRRSIARRVCAVVFIFSFLRSIYLPLMYTPNCYRGFDQKKNRVLDIYEFLISLAIPYLIILVANISLIRSLRKQNNLMSVSYSLTSNYNFNGILSARNGGSGGSGGSNMLCANRSPCNAIGDVNAPLNNCTPAPIIEQQESSVQMEQEVEQSRRRVRPIKIRGLSKSLRSRKTSNNGGNSVSPNTIIVTPNESLNASEFQRRHSSKIFSFSKRSTLSLQHTQDEITPISIKSKSQNPTNTSDSRTTTTASNELRQNNSLGNICTGNGVSSPNSSPNHQPGQNQSPVKTTNTNKPANNQPRQSLNTPNKQSQQNRLNRRINSTASQTTNGTIISACTTSSIYSPQTRSNSNNNNKLNNLYRKTTNAREMRNQKKLTTTLIIILCLLLVCYLPSFLFEESLANSIFGDHEQPGQPEAPQVIKIKSIGYRISFVLIYINCSANFLIYCICNKKFKNSLKLLAKKSCFMRLFQRFKLFSRDECRCCTLFSICRCHRPKYAPAITHHNHRNSSNHIVLYHLNNNVVPNNNTIVMNNNNNLSNINMIRNNIRKGNILDSDLELNEWEGGGSPKTNHRH